LAEIPHEDLIRICETEGAGCEIDARAGVQGGGCEGGDGCDGLGRAHFQGIFEVLEVGGGDGEVLGAHGEHAVVVEGDAAEHGYQQANE